MVCATITPLLKGASAGWKRKSDVHKPPQGGCAQVKILWRTSRNQMGRCCRNNELMVNWNVCNLGDFYDNLVTKKKSMVMDDIIMPSWIISWPLWKEDETGSRDQNGLDTSLATSIDTKMSHSSLRKEDEHPEFIHAFNAYTPPGDIVGDLVFVLSWKYYASESMIYKAWGHFFL